MKDKNKCGRNSLHYVIEKNNVEIVKVLTDYSIKNKINFRNQ